MYKKEYIQPECYRNKEIINVEKKDVIDIGNYIQNRKI